VLTRVKTAKERKRERERESERDTELNMTDVYPVDKNAAATGGTTTTAETAKAAVANSSALAYEEAAAENARVAAEARRKRILEKADKRLGVVSGEQPVSVVDDVEKKSNASNAARIRAARASAKRYGKKSESTTTDATTTTTGGAENLSPSTTVEVSSAVSEVIVAETLALPETLIKTTSTGIDTNQPDTVTADTTAATAAAAAAPVEKVETAVEQIPTSKKKYQGVAKMRRKMIAQKKIEESDETVGGVSSSFEGTMTIAGNKVVIPLKKKVAVLPVWMHIVTVLLLFGAGFDVGIQQFHEDVHIHTKSAVQEYGIPLVHRQPWKALAPLVSNSDGILSSQEEEYLSQQGKDSNIDEFQDTENEYVPNIDPIFGIDLDELTNGPGVLNQLAKVAIGMHRSILWLVYFTPISIFNSLIAIPMALIRMPPILFIVAVVTRQVVGKAILGAAIPEVKADSNSDGGNNIEVISMAKNFIKNTMMTNFPTLFTLYDVFTHVRTDMYIVICGVFCGLIWTHFFLPTTIMDDQSVSPSEGGNDEL
jgi:hypothetical protein